MDAHASGWRRVLRSCWSEYRSGFLPTPRYRRRVGYHMGGGWIEALCKLSGLKVTPRQRNSIADAVLQLRFSPTRTLTELSANVQDIEVRDALQHFTVAGRLGALLDAETDSLG